MKKQPVTIDSNKSLNQPGQAGQMGLHPFMVWSLVALVVVFSVVGMLLDLGTRPAQASIWDIGNRILTALFTVVFGIVGALILARHSRHRIGWLLMCIALALSVLGSLQSYLAQFESATGPLTLAMWLGIWLNGWSWWLLIGPLLLILLFFPTGTLLTRRWRWAVVAIGSMFLFFLFYATFNRAMTDPYTGANIANPIGVLPESFTFDVILIPWEIALLGTAAACVASVFVRYRRSGPVERQQIKWFLYACTLFIFVYVLAGSQAGENPAFQVLFSIAILLIPASIGVAVLRYHLWDIDLLIRRTLIYGVLSLLLALLYLGAVVLLQRLLVGVTGQGSDLAIILSTLAIAAIFVPLRRRVQMTIDRRFYRRKYDARRVLEGFATTARDEVDLGRLLNELQAVVEETIQPEQVSVWLAEKRRNHA